MRLSVITNIELDKIQELVTKEFGQFGRDHHIVEDNRYGKVNKKYDFPYFKDNLKKIVWFKKLSNTNSLDLVFTGCK